jgi:hypothetical protein
MTFSWFGEPWKHRISVWDCISIYYMTEVFTTSGLSATMLDFLAVNDASSVALRFLASAVPDSMIKAFEIFISCQIQPEIWELPFYCRHLRFPFERYVQQCRRWHHWKVCPRKHGGSRQNIVSTCYGTRDTPGGISTPWTTNVSILYWTLGRD